MVLHTAVYPRPSTESLRATTVLNAAAACRYAKEWERTVTRLGRWIDFENDYKTLNPSFMESVWWVFGQLWDKGLVYRGFKVQILLSSIDAVVASPSIDKSR